MSNPRAMMAVMSIIKNRPALKERPVMEKLSIVIPVYNEEEALPETVSFFDDFLKTNPSSEVIFIDDDQRIKARIF